VETEYFKGVVKMKKSSVQIQTLIFLVEDNERIVMEIFP